MSFFSSMGPSLPSFKLAKKDSLSQNPGSRYLMQLPCGRAWTVRLFYSNVVRGGLEKTVRAQASELVQLAWSQVHWMRWSTNGISSRTFCGLTFLWKDHDFLDCLMISPNTVYIEQTKPVHRRVSCLGHMQTYTAHVSDKTQVKKTSIFRRNDW